MDRSWSILLSVLILFLQGVTSQDAKTHCFKPSQTSVKLFVECPVGHVVEIQSSLYGSNQYQECTNTHDTCVDEPRDIKDSECVGRRNCTIVARRMYSVKCGGYVNFFRVIYECFPAGARVTNGSVMTTTTPPGVPVWFGPAVPKRAKGADSDSDSDTGIILAVVGCAIGTLYISVICIVLALLVRRNGIGANAQLAKDEEQPAEVDNSAYKTSPQFKERLAVSSELTSLEETHESSITRDPNGNIVEQGRAGPDGREETKVFEEFQRPEFGVESEKQNTRVTFASERNTSENSAQLERHLYPVEQLYGLPQETDYHLPASYRNESRDYRESSRTVSSC